ncbi:pseudouridine synthase [Corynebacterium sp. KPL2838]|uniref:pseudouridine synthase n=1 Tax=Corynebacterium sp. KPL2838 TaxID=3158316 RepID=UPI0032ECC65B
MSNTLIHHKKGFSPLPIKNGLNPTRVRTPEEGLSTWDFLSEVISSQRHRHPNDDAQALRDRFTAGEVVLRDQTPLKPGTVLGKDVDVFFYRIPAPETPVPYDIPIIYEDDNILVADKPPFMATMPRARHIVETATVRLRRSTGNNELVPAHRLDRLTSGLLLFTKHKDVRGAYQSLFAEKKVHKTYQAVAEFRRLPTPLQWSSHLTKTPGEIQGRIADGESNAFTTLESVEPINKGPYEKIHGSLADLGIYTLKPQTGKTHQLRLHMWQAGTPILGDPVYPTIFPEEAEDMSVPMHLTATDLEFADPLSGKPRHFISGLPLVMHKLL